MSGIECCQSASMTGFGRTTLQILVTRYFLNSNVGYVNRKRGELWCLSVQDINWKSRMSAGGCDACSAGHLHLSNNQKRDCMPSIPYVDVSALLPDVSPSVFSFICPSLSSSLCLSLSEFTLYSTKPSFVWWFQSPTPWMVS